MQIQNLFENQSILETERLLLRRFSLYDVNDYYEFASKPIVTAYMNWGPYVSIDNSVRYITSVLNKYETQEAFHWAVILKQTNKLIGRTGFAHIDKPNRKVEMGYVLSDNFWNQGLGTEANKAVLKYGFEDLKINRIEARCSVNNVASQKLLQKIGMTFEGILREEKYIKGQFTNKKIFSILRSEYVGRIEEGSSIS